MSDLKQGIAYIYDMEKSNYLLTRAMQDIDNEINIKFDSSAALADIPVPSEPRYTQFGGAGSKSLWIGVGAVICAVLAAVVTVIYAIVQGGPGAVTQGVESVLDESTIIAIVWGTIGAGAIGVVLALIGRSVYCSLMEKSYAASNEKKRNTYLREKTQYEEKCTVAEKEAKKQWDKRRKALFAVKDQMHSKIMQTNGVLAAFYEKMGIDPKFRNIVPIAYMNEFLRLGVTDKLDGADGLYYLTMHELRMDQMNQKLEVISQRLDSVVNRQHSLYSELMSMNQKCDNMISASIRQTDALIAQNHLLDNQNDLMKKIEQKTAVAAYNSERVAQEAKYQSYLKSYDRW